MPSGLSSKLSALRERIEAGIAGREAGKFGEVANPKWASATWGNLPITDSPQMRKSTLLFLPSASHGPLRFVLHRNVLSGVAGPSHRIVALNRNGRLKGEIVFTCAKDAVSIDALNSERRNAGLGRSLVLLFAQHVPKGKEVTVHSSHEAMPFYENLGFRHMGETPTGSQMLVCKREELFKNKDELGKAGARKGRVFVK
jgi:hypothetical protein